VWLGGALSAILTTGMRVLSLREWEARERRIYGDLRYLSLPVTGNGCSSFHCSLGRRSRRGWRPRAQQTDGIRAIELAVVGLAGLHRFGYTHGDAMAENVMIDLPAGVAHWFDFETVQDATPTSRRSWLAGRRRVDGAAAG
jgi:hypothetical protein